MAGDGPLWPRSAIAKGRYSQKGPLYPGSAIAKRSAIAKVRYS